MYSWEQTTNCKQLFGEGYRVALKSFHQLVMDGSRSTAAYPSNGWMASPPLQFFLSFSPVFCVNYASYPPVPALQMALNAPICAAFANATIISDLK